WKIKNGDGRYFFIEVTKDLSGADILVVRAEQRTYDLAPQSFSVEVSGGLTVKSGPGDDAYELLHVDGGFAIRITTSRFEFFVTAGGSITPIGLGGRVTGLLVIDSSIASPGIPGVAALLSLEITAGTGPSSSGGGVADIAGILTFKGKVQVMLNTTMREQTYPVPESFLSVLPADYPTTITIYDSRPSLDGSAEADPNADPAIYVAALVSGTIT